MKYFILMLSIISIVFYSCGKKSVRYGKKFFTYDHVDYYFVDSDERFKPLRSDTLVAEFDSVNLEFRGGDIPPSVSDTFYMRFIDEMGYKHQVIDAKYFPSLDSVFIEKFIDLDNSYSTACAPIYRDVLIFRHQGKISGIAKVCFHCGIDFVRGTSANTENLDLYRLKNVLRNYRTDPKPME